MVWTGDLEKFKVYQDEDGYFVSGLHGVHRYKTESAAKKASVFLKRRAIEEIDRENEAYEHKVKNKSDTLLAQLQKARIHRRRVLNGEFETDDDGMVKFSSLIKKDKTRVRRMLEKATPIKAIQKSINVSRRSLLQVITRNKYEGYRTNKRAKDS